jgi:outer membrane protein assembly factor BamE (lipoprotein component of BamABCDE complex)
MAGLAASTAYAFPIGFANMNDEVTSLLFAAAIVCAFTGCATPGQTYAKQHPELSAQQVQILNTGKIPDGTAVAGMTQEQVKLAMGIEPAQYTKIDGQDAWVYVQRKLSTTGITPTDSLGLNHHDTRNQKALEEDESHAPADQPQIKTTVYFQGDRATRAEVVNGGL